MAVNVVCVFSFRCRELVCSMWLVYFLVTGGAIVKFEHVLLGLYSALLFNDFNRIATGSLKVVLHMKGGQGGPNPPPPPP